MKKIFQLWKERFAESLLVEHENPKYHKEGNVLTHTLMVFNEANLDEDEVMAIIALLHDLGKPLAARYEDGRKMFTKHEGISTFLSVNFLKELLELNKIDKDEFWYILNVINAHGDFIKYKDSKKHWDLYRYESLKFEWLKSFNKYDDKGRISINPYIKPDIRLTFESLKRKFNEDKPYVVFNIGVPATGKTTWVNRNLDEDVEIISRDGVLEKYGREKKLGCTYSEIWSNLTDEDQKEIDNIFDQKLKSLQDENKNICIDMTLISYKSRRKMLSKIKNNYQVVYLNFIADYEDILKRNKKRFEETGKNIPEQVLINFMKNYQFPLYGEDKRLVEISNIVL